jgi:hypothetical protein
LLVGSAGERFYHPPAAATVLNDIVTTTTVAIADKFAAVAGVPKLK